MTITLSGNALRHPDRPFRATISLALALAISLAGCGSGDAAPTDDASALADEGGDADAAAFPVTIEHKYGEVTINGAPERVVSIGYSDQDDLLALGVEPIAVRDWYGEQPFAVWPWAQDELGDLEPEVLPSTELSFEQIAALDPDLIIGVSSGITAEEYEILSAIAPTVAQSGEVVDYGMPWQERTLLIGQAVGQPELAATLVADIEDRFASERQANPDFNGASAAVAFLHEDQPGAYTSADSRSRIMVDLGFTIPETYDEIAGDAFYASFSNEEIDHLDVDLLAWIATTEPELQAIADLELRDGLSAHQDGREVFIGDVLGGAFSFASPLSLDYLLDELVPELALAVDGDPATTVPSAARFDDTVGGDTTDGAADGAADRAASEEEQAAMDAWALVFDSAASFDDKAAHLEDAASLEASNEGYAAAAEGLGGISLEPTAATVDGDRATISYDVLFGGSAAYTDLEGTMSRVDGVWTVGADTYCDFLAQARSACV